MQSFPVPAGIARKDGILVLGLHLRLSRHLSLPPFHRRDGDTLLLQGVVDTIYDPVDSSHPLPVAVFLRGRHAPWNFPATDFSCGPRAPRRLGRQYQRRPPRSDCEGFNAPNIVVCCGRSSRRTAGGVQAKLCGSRMSQRIGTKFCTLV